MTNSIERLRVDVNGNVGIGTTSPSTNLSVQGNGLLSGTLTAANFIATSTFTVGSTYLNSGGLTINSGTGLQSIAGNAGFQFAYNGENLFTLSRTGSGVVNSVNIQAATTGIGRPYQRQERQMSR